jgi:predicted PurR-regulated permease PerM
VVDKVGAYMIGNLLISLVAGTAAFIAFEALRVPFAVPLGFVVAITDLIPMIGASLGAVVCVLVALFATHLWPNTVLVAAYFVVYQQVENYWIAPRILRSSVNLSAAAVLLAGLIGGTALGLVGALMAIPVAAAMRVVLSEELAARDATATDGDGDGDGDEGAEPEAAPPPGQATAEADTRERPVRR